MSGSGYRVWQAGEKLLDTNFQNYLQDQTVMRFASAAARSSAITSPVEGMMSTLDDTDLLYRYSGTAWVEAGGGGGAGLTVSDTAPSTPVNGAQWFNSTNGKTYVYYTDANSSQWVELDSSGAPISSAVPSGNAIINGAFDIWQRGTSFSPAAGNFLADRWLALFDGSGATRTISQQSFTPGAAPVSGYEGSYFLRWNQSVAGSGGTFNVLTQKIEDVRAFAGQTITLSFWVKADATRSISAALTQAFGSGGSSAVGFTLGTANATTSWQRVSMTYAIPSIAGKTIGTNSYLQLDIVLPTNTAQTIDIWGVQLEAGSVATPFKRNAPSIQAELAACQRYYFRYSASSSFALFGSGSASSTTSARIVCKSPVTMRFNPSAVEFSNLGLNDGVTGPAVTNVAIETGVISQDNISLTVTVASGLTQYRPYVMIAGTTSGYIGLSAEL